MLAVFKQFNGVENCKYFHKYIIYNHFYIKIFYALEP